MIGYLSAHGVFDAARFNAIYEEFERKVGLILSHKSPVLARHLRTGLWGIFGRQVYFVSGTQAYTAGLSTHDEGVWDAAVAGATIEGYDHTLHIASCSETVPDLDDSLMARSVEYSGLRYYLKQHLNRAEKRHPYGVLDVIVEGPEVLTFPSTWDKYGCVRIHNCRLFAGLTVTFEGLFAGGETARVVTVPRGECRTYRLERDANGVPTEIEESGTYFWRARATDPCPVGPAYTPYFPEASYRASNILSPRVMLAWIEALRTPDVGSQLGWVVDESVLTEVEESYREAFYADPELPGTYLGNLIHHRGELYVERTGYDSALIPFGGYGVPMSSLVQVVGDGAGGWQLERTDPLVTYVSGMSTNLLENGEGAHWTVNLTGGAVVALSSEIALIDPAPAQRWLAVYPGRTDPWVLTTSTATTTESVSVDWVNGADEPATVVGLYEVFTGAPEVPVVYEFKSGDQVAALSARSDAMALARAGLTPLGPTFVFDRPLDVSLPGWGEWRSEEQVLRLRGHGWPTWDLDGRMELGQVPTHRHVVWPRPPLVVRPFGVSEPPDATGLGDTLDGAPWVVAGPSVPLPLERREKRFLMPLGEMAGEGSTLSGGWWRAWSYEGRAIRVPRTAEEHNWLAWRCNQLREGRPLCLADLRFALEGGVATLPPGPSDLLAWPVDHYCRAEAEDSSQAALLAECGAAYATLEDFPERWKTQADLVTSGAPKLTVYSALPVTNSGAAKVLRTDSGSDAWFVTWSQAYGTPVATVESSTDEPSRVNTNAGTISADFRWVSDAVAGEVAARAGVPLIRTRMGRGWKCVVEPPQAPNLAWGSSIAARAVAAGPWANEWEADAYLAALPAETVIGGSIPVDHAYSELNGGMGGKTAICAVPAESEADVDLVVDELNVWGLPADRNQEGLVTRFDADGIELTAGKEEFHATSVDPYGWTGSTYPMESFRAGVGCWQAARSADWWRFWGGSRLTMLGVTGFSPDAGLKSISRAALTPTYLWDRAGGNNVGEASHDRLTAYYGSSDPRQPSYISPAPSEAQVVTWSGPLKVLSPPGSAKAAIVRAELAVVVDLEWVPPTP